MEEITQANGCNIKICQNEQTAICNKINRTNLLSSKFPNPRQLFITYLSQANQLSIADTKVFVTSLLSSIHFVLSILVKFLSKKATYNANAMRKLLEKSMFGFIDQILSLKSEEWHGFAENPWLYISFDMASPFVIHLIY